MTYLVTLAEIPKMLLKFLLKSFDIYHNPIWGVQAVFPMRFLLLSSHLSLILLNNDGDNVLSTSDTGPCE